MLVFEGVLVLDGVGVFDRVGVAVPVLLGVSDGVGVLEGVTEGLVLGSPRIQKVASSSWGMDKGRVIAFSQSRREKPQLPSNSNSGTTENKLFQSTA